MLNEEKLIELTEKYLNQIEWLFEDFKNLEIQEQEKIYTDIIKIINFHNNLYYIEASPIISDYQYDKIFDFLKKVENQYPYLIRQDSPTQRISVWIQESFSQQAHKIPMLSLDNSYNIKDIQEWYDFVRKILEKNWYTNWTFHLEPKFDGSSVELVYFNWYFYKAITRWDWFVWEDITENVKTISSVPVYLKAFENIKELRVRGEIMMPKKSFEKLNSQRQKQWLTSFANPRNAAAGSLRQLNTKVTAERKLVCFIYDLLYISWEQKENIYFLENFLNKSKEKIIQKDIFQMLSNIWFYVFDWRYVEQNIQKIFDKCQEPATIEFLEKQNIEFDWMVIKINEIFLREMLWETAHHPRRAIAFKFPAQEVTTKIKWVKFNVGRTWIITPTAQLEPVEVSWVVVSNATLHNFDFIENKDIRIGDYVWLKRSGEVIPYVIKSIKERRDKNKTEKIFPPEFCPICNSKIIKLPWEVYYYCSNINCPSVIKEKIIHFASKDWMYIEWLWEKIVYYLVDASIIQHFADIYKIKNPQIRYKVVSLPWMWKKSVDELIKQIELTKQNYLWRILNALWIRYIWKKTAKMIEESIYKNLKSYKNSFEKIKNFQVDNLIEFLQDKEFLESIYWIWEKIVQSVLKYISEDENKKIIKELESEGVNFNIFSLQEEKYTNMKWIKFSITGKFSFSRNYIINVLEKYWAEFDNNPTKKTDFLLAWKESGSKLEKAQNNWTKIIHEITKLLKDYPFLKDELISNENELWNKSLF